MPDYTSAGVGVLARRYRLAQAEAERTQLLMTPRPILDTDTQHEFWPTVFRPAPKLHGVKAHQDRLLVLATETVTRWHLSRHQGNLWIRLYPVLNEMKEIVIRLNMMKHGSFSWYQNSLDRTLTEDYK